MKMKKLLASVLCVVMVLSAMGLTAFAENGATNLPEVDIAVGENQTHTSWTADMLDDAKDVNNDGEVTYGIYGKVILKDVLDIKGNTDTVNIIGMTEDAELYVDKGPDVHGIITVSSSAIKNVNFSNIKLTRENGNHITDGGHHNRVFTVWVRYSGADAVATYTNCVFPWGSGNNQYGKTVYKNCTFNHPVYYALWIYNGEVEVTGSTFEADRGVKTYSEGNEEIKTTIKDSTFNIASKPAIVSSSKGTMVIEKVDASACKYGLVTSEAKDHVISSGLSTITVDGKEPEWAAVVNGEYHSSADYARDEKRGTVEYLKPYGKLHVGAVNANDANRTFITVEMDVYAKESIKLEIYDKDDNLLATTTSTAKVFDGEIKFPFYGLSSFTGINAKDDYWTTKWEPNKLRADYVPKKTVLYVDGVKVSEGTISDQLTGEVTKLDWPSIPGVYPVPGARFNGVSAKLEPISDTNDRENFTVELVDIAAYESIAVKTYNGDKLLATTTLRATDRDDNTPVAVYPYIRDSLTANVVVAGRLAGSWDTEWHVAPNATDVPDSFELVIDGESAGKFNREFTPAETAKWKALTGVYKMCEINGDAFATVQSALDSVKGKPGDYELVIYPSIKAYDESFTVIQEEGVNVTIKAENKGDVTLTGTITVCGAGRSNGTETLTIENLVFDGSEKTTAHDFIKDDKLTYNYSYLHNMTVRNCDFIGNGNNAAPVVGVRAGKSGAYYTVLDNCSAKDMFNFADMRGSSSITITNSKFTNMGEGVFNAHNTQAIVFNNNFVDGAALYAVRSGQTTNASDSVVIQMNNNTIYAPTALALRNTSATLTMKQNIIIADDAYTLTNAKIYMLNGVKYENEEDLLKAFAQVNQIIPAEINVEFDEVEKDGKIVEGLYNIVLTAEDDIYEFVGAEFKFANTSKTTAGEYMEYEILGIAGQTSAEKSVEKDAQGIYTYALRLVDGAKRMSGKKLIIGQVQFHGHGTINFDVSYGKVVTTEFATNLGQYYIKDTDTTTKDSLGSVAITGGSVVEKKRDVVINVAYNHPLVNAWDNEEITVTLKDGFGNIYGPYDISDGQVRVSEDEQSDEWKFVKLGRLTVTLEAPGFRKYVYYTTLEEGESALVLNFWNNVKRDEEVGGVVIDPVEEIETGKGYMTDNFLVGDIVMDYTVDEYDLAAVTSYYGTYDIENVSKYLKYDLNRDGNIDIIDVHYVLHTLNN